MVFSPSEHLHIVGIVCYERAEQIKSCKRRSDYWTYSNSWADRDTIVMGWKVLNIFLTHYSKRMGAGVPIACLLLDIV